MDPDRRIPIPTKVAYGIEEEGNYVYVGLGFENGISLPPTVAGVAFNQDRLAELHDVQPIASVEEFKQFLLERSRIPRQQVPAIIGHFQGHF